MRPVGTLSLRVRTRHRRPVLTVAQNPEIAFFVSMCTIKQPTNEQKRTFDGENLARLTSLSFGSRAPLGLAVAATRKRWEGVVAVVSAAAHTKQHGLSHARSRRLESIHGTAYRLSHTSRKLMFVRVRIGANLYTRQDTVANGANKNLTNFGIEDRGKGR
ncbi:hypothetical protein PoB_003021800 [Plakobranchus ocellatus]|uniref:Uncharacterized protein n=1 Tax=Plakobranchus ocellatus TaxID=259542 RepID=A0AAV4A8Z9_9GAST|nr:hypothetical protein PoB_003021800 [Plakobranchus ocellatus]